MRISEMSTNHSMGKTRFLASCTHTHTCTSTTQYMIQHTVHDATVGYNLSGIASHFATQVVHVCDASLTARAKSSDALLNAAHLYTCAYSSKRCKLFMQAWWSASSLPCTCAISFQFYVGRHIWCLQQ